MNYCGLNPFSSMWRPMTGSCECNNEIWGTLHSRSVDQSLPSKALCNTVTFFGISITYSEKSIDFVQ